MKYRKLDGYKYEVYKDVAYGLFGLIPDVRESILGYAKLSYGILTIYKGYAWDGASRPAIDTKNFMSGSLVHDVLYQMMREGVLDRKYRKAADEILRKMCIEQGMSKLRAWYVYRAVRLFGHKQSLPRKNPRGKIITI